MRRAGDPDPLAGAAHLDAGGLRNAHARGGRCRGRPRRSRIPADTSARLGNARSLLEPVRTLAALLLEGAQESVKMFEAASHVTPEGASEDLQDFFAAADRIVGLEHETDAAERAVTSALLKGSADVKTFHLLWRAWDRRWRAPRTAWRSARSNCATICSTMSSPGEFAVTDIASTCS